MKSTCKFFSRILTSKYEITKHLGQKWKIRNYEAEGVLKAYEAAAWISKSCFQIIMCKIITLTMHHFNYIYLYIKSTLGFILILPISMKEKSRKKTPHSLGLDYETSTSFIFPLITSQNGFEMKRFAEEVSDVFWRCEIVVLWGDGKRTVSLGRPEQQNVNAHFIISWYVV